MAGGVPKFVPLRPEPLSGTENRANDIFNVNFDEMEAAITPKTKALILNSPHNPTGKMFSRVELENIAAIIHRNPHVIVISDEVSFGNWWFQD